MTPGQTTAWTPEAVGSTGGLAIMIPEKFYLDKLEQPIASTVGELKKALSELPDDLRVTSGWDKPVVLAVWNHGTHDEHLEFGEPEEFED